MSLVYRYLQNTVNRDDIAWITFSKLYVICYNISDNFVTRCDWTLVVNFLYGIWSGSLWISHSLLSNQKRQVLPRDLPIYLRLVPDRW